jgi:hypothetical protein
MTTGSVFTLVSNNGLQDKWLTATEILRARFALYTETQIAQRDAEIAYAKANKYPVPEPLLPGDKKLVPTTAVIEKTHVLFFRQKFRPYVALAYEYQKVPSNQAQFGNSVRFSVPQFGEFINDIALHIRLEGLKATSAIDRVKYCDFLGHRLLKHSAFSVNGNLLEEYSNNYYNIFYNFKVLEHKKTAWKRCVGQEVPKLGYLIQDPEYDEVRELKTFVDGPQTGKNEHVVVDMWIPLLFWFCEDAKAAFPSVSVPQGQRFIDIQFEEQEKLMIGINNGGGGTFTAPSITRCNLYINNIFVNPEIHDIYIRKLGFSLIRVIKEQSIAVTKPAQRLKMTGIKWPVETLYMGLKPDINNNFVDDWHRYHDVTDTIVRQPRVIQIPVETLVIGSAEYKSEAPSVDELEISAHGVTLYKNSSSFFNSYMSYKYGKVNIASPEDSGLFFIPFNLYPGEYQPSGSFNASRAREFFVQYASSVISASNPGVFYIFAVALNFLVVRDGTATLRYTT